MILEIDYEGVSLGSRTANSKAAASTISDVFQKHYPEFLVRVPLRHLRAHEINLDPSALGAQVLCERPSDHDVDFLALQAHFVSRDSGQDESRRHWPAHDREGSPSAN